MTQSERRDPDVVRDRSGGSWEESIGSARAVAAGDRVLVAGTMPLADGKVLGEGSPYEQTKAAFGKALEALEPFGLDASSVVCTRMYLTHLRDVEDVGRAHRELFGEVAPAATVLVVSGFADFRVLVQVELEAYRGDRG